MNKLHQKNGNIEDRIWRLYDSDNGQYSFGARMEHDFKSWISTFQRVADQVVRLADGQTDAPDWTEQKLILLRDSRERPDQDFHVQVLWTWTYIHVVCVSAFLHTCLDTTGRFTSSPEIFRNGCYKILENVPKIKFEGLNIGNKAEQLGTWCKDIHAMCKLFRWDKNQAPIGKQLLDALDLFERHRMCHFRLPSSMDEPNEDALTLEIDNSFDGTEESANTQATGTTGTCPPDCSFRTDTLCSVHDVSFSKASSEPDSVSQKQFL